MTNRYRLLLRRAWTMYPWRRNPLLPASYRLRYALRAALLGTLVAAIPVAVALGTTSYSHFAQDSDRQRVVLHRIDATADADASVIWGEETAVPAEWNYAGTGHTATIPANSTTHARDRVEIWVTAAGDETAPPPTRSQDIGDAVVAAISAYLAGALAVAIALWAVDRMVDRHRYRLWDQEWAALAADRRWNSR
ncbi:hypothetical protein [Nocardia sp. alder85J]|uniref:Rv1733c family protein n=1 Tax=Nocardia sp. alder85J TaxID=2862949 RepID=UPI001CD2F64E|nr:hypothetical protein [Nocardia sp. alder85J]MCX4092489.1 hypothetical protein [Nocardia sp. alder85J]